jgi:hypothetical protein
MLGRREKIVIWDKKITSDMKVIFQDSKVADVQ